MPAPRHKYDQAIQIAIANNRGATPRAIRQALFEALTRGYGIPEEDVPSEDTVRRRKAELDAADLKNLQEIHWPDSFGPGGLPEEAAPAVIQWVARCILLGQERPIFRAAYWLWQIASIKPDSSLEERVSAAWLLTAIDFNVLAVESRAAVEKWLALSGAASLYFALGTIGERYGYSYEVAARIGMKQNDDTARSVEPLEGVENATHE